MPACSRALLMRGVPIAALTFTFLVPHVRSQGVGVMPNPPAFPAENPPLPGQSTLGKILFWDEQLSSDNTVACGTCHIHESGGSDPRSFETPNPGPDVQFGTADDIRGSAGLVHQDGAGNFASSDPFFPDARVTTRKAPSAINAVYFNELFWDGRATGKAIDPQTGTIATATLGALESQATSPPVSDVEMAHGNRTWNDVTARLALVDPLALAKDLPAEMQAFRDLYPTYPAMFEVVYGDPTITASRIMYAIGNYERTLIADETVLDSWLKGQITELPPDLGPGFALFTGKGNCTTCHVLPFTMDNGYHNIGVRPDSEDVGRLAVTGQLADMARFKTPNLRNAALRLPLFHNGSIDSLAELVDFYNKGGIFTGPNTDTALHPLNLTAQEQADLVHFIEAGLTDPRVANHQIPFTRPTLRSELPPSNAQFGVASANGAGILPELLTNVPANHGHPEFKVGVHRTTAHAAAIFALAFAPGDGAPLADPRFPIPMNIDVGTLALLLPTMTDVTGVATAQLAIPNSTALVGFVLFGQYFIQDAAAVATGGICGSKGVSISIL